MKKAIIFTCLTLSALLILDSMNAGQAFAMLIIAGQVPGTNVYLNAGTMLEVFALLTGFVLARISNTAVLSILSRTKVLRSV